MENEKKSSRFGVRLSAIFAAVLMVVCMAVPAFAATVVPDEYNKLPIALELPDGCSFYVLGYKYEPSGDELYRCVAFSAVAEGVPEFYAVEGVSGKYRLELGRDNGEVYRCTLSSDGSIVEDWTSISYTTYNFFRKSTLFSNTILYNDSGNVVYTPIEPPPPPPPDLKQEVTSGLTIVLDWVGATVSALFSGELSGLLPLVAIPVAITILIVAIVVIKRSIWGA